MKNASCVIPLLFLVVSPGTVLALEPANPESRGPWEQGGDLEKLLLPGNETHDRWMKDLDTLAAGLKELQEADVVVLWRPFHEMNGGWFWWGAKQPETFIRVWRHMFDYFTKTKGLDNLLKTRNNSWSTHGW